MWPRLIGGFLLMTILMTSQNVSGEHLHFASPGQPEAEGSKGPGIYGGQVTVDDEGMGDNLYEYGFQCNAIDDSTENLAITSMSYDAALGEVLMLVDTGRDNIVTLQRGVVCSPLKDCDGDKSNNNITSLMTNTGVSGKIGAVAQYNGEIFFIVMKEEIKGRGYHVTVQLRKLTLAACDLEFPLTETSLFDLDDCSELIVDILSEDYDSHNPYRMSGHLAIVPWAEDSYFFYTQIGRKIYDGSTLSQYSLELWEVCPMKDLKLINNQTLTVELALLDFGQVGGISYRKDKLCWSAMEYIKCGTWKAGKITDIERVLEPSEIAEVCLGTPAHDSLSSRVSTGLAIADTSENRLRFYFGCMVDHRGNGGAGFVDINHHKESHTSIHPIKNQNNKVYAGSMFLSQSCEGEGVVGGAYPLISSVFTIVACLSCYLHLFYL